MAITTASDSNRGARNGSALGLRRSAAKPAVRKTSSGRLTRNSAVSFGRKIAVGSSVSPRPALRMRNTSGISFTAPKACVIACLTGSHSKGRAGVRQGVGIGRGPS